MTKYVLLGLLALASFDLSAIDYTVNQDADGIRIVPQAEYAGATVVLLDGSEIHRELHFAADESILIPVPDHDGRFRYEITLQPVLDDEQRNARAADRGSVQIELPKLTGGFTVDDRSLITPASEDTDGARDAGPGPQPLATVLANNDGVIRFSLCVGGDCPTSPSFGSDTIRLQENNLRIHFDDTSTGAFPANDWRLVANEQNSGQRDIFAIEDATAGRFIAAFEAGAPANSLYVASNGNIGVGTLSPGSLEINVADGDSPSLRLQQDGSSGFTAQSFDLVANESNFFIRDVTNGSALPFRIQPGADGNSLTMDNEGQVGIGLPGTGIPEASATLHLRARNVGGDDVVLFEDSTGADLLTLDTGGDLTLTGTLAQLSRRDSKEHFSPVDHRALLAALKDLPITTWNYKHQPDDQRHLGPVAEDFHAAYGLGESAEHIAASDMAAVALAASQALVHEVEARDTRIAELEDRLARMEVMLQTLMADREEQTAPTLTSR